MIGIPTFDHVAFPLDRGRGVAPYYGGGLVNGALPTDPIGLHTLTLNNVVVGSRINIRDQSDTTTLYDQIAASGTVVIPLQVYAGGSPLNNWRIRIRRASASPTYRPYETLMTATVGASSIYVSQIPDE